MSAEMKKSSTGIPGLDEIVDGGIPQGRCTLIKGGAGSGKTVMSLQSLVHGARSCGEPGIFVAFEETAARILVNAASFGWELPKLQEEGLFFLDAQPDSRLVQSGDFDFGGMLAALGAKAKAMGARRIAFDAIDIVLSLLENPRAVQREVYRLHDWLLANNMTAIITSKSSSTFLAPSFSSLDFMQFMTDCVITLDHEITEGVSLRRLRVMKYRGTAFEENEIPYLIGGQGVEVGYGTRGRDDASASVSTERVSTGIDRLDTMLCGGYFRGASILVTGAPGTAKTTLAGTFIEAACKRGEATLFITFDSSEDEIVRNLASVGLNLAEYLRDGTLQMGYLRSLRGSAESRLIEIKKMAAERPVRCVALDPISALSKKGGGALAFDVVDRLIGWAKSKGITLFCSSLLDSNSPELESTPIQISTIADTWIHLSYLVKSGERNRALSIVKSRGTSHSNQVRELILSEKGITLADVYTAGGDVLMGSLRLEKERTEAERRRAAEEESLRQGEDLEGKVAELEQQRIRIDKKIARVREERKSIGVAIAETNEEEQQIQKKRSKDRRADHKGS